MAPGRNAEFDILQRAKSSADAIQLFASEISTMFPDRENEIDRMALVDAIAGMVSAQERDGSPPNIDVG